MGWMNRQWGGLKTEWSGPEIGEWCTKSSWKPIITHITPGSILGPILFNTFVNVLDDGSEYNHSKLGRSGWFTQGSYWGPQRNLHRLEKWAVRNLKKFNKEKCRVLHLRRNSYRHQDMLGTANWKADLRKRTWGPGGHQDLYYSAMWSILPLRSLMIFLPAFGKVSSAGQERRFFPSTKHRWCCTWRTGSSSGLASTREI